MSSQSLYRKWRSQSFEDILGQPHVVQTLRNAVSNERIAHAYLFTGPRGTGKTSMARIMAKAVSCLNPTDGSPCTVCPMCLSIAEGRSPDVIEIDGASNNGIDDIRALRERAGFAPVEGRYKVYIIDEVHRVTVQGFDALLKTLEEPPPHILFIFASTEPHKVPATILSRCQRFDFRKIDRQTTAQRVLQVATAEGIDLDGEATALIAQQAGGSLRDALGILDQVRAFAGDTVTAQDVRDGVGIGRPELVANITRRMLDEDIGGALRAVNEAVGLGVDPRSLGHQIIEYWRALLLFVAETGQNADIDPLLAEAAPVHASRLSPSVTIQVLRALTEQVIEPRLNVSPQLPLEIGLVQAILALSGANRPASTLEKRPGAEAVDDDRQGASSTPTRRVREDAEQPVRREQEMAHDDPVPNQVDPVATMGNEPSNTSEPLGISSLASHGTEKSDGSNGFPEVWPRIIDAARTRSRKLQAVLRDAEPVEWSDKEITLAFRFPFHRNEADRQENRAEAQALIAEVIGTRLKVRCVLASGDSPTTPPDDADTFAREAERMLRGVHARQFRSSKNES